MASEPRSWTIWVDKRDPANIFVPDPRESPESMRDYYAVTVVPEGQEIDGAIRALREKAGDQAGHVWDGLRYAAGFLNDLRAKR